MYELRTGYWILSGREMEPSACVHVFPPCSAGKWPQWSLKLNTLLLLWVFIIVVTIVVPGQQGCIEEVEQKILEMEENKKKKKYFADYFKGSEWSTRQGIKPQWAGELKAICWSIVYSSCGFCKLRYCPKDKSFLNVSAGKLRTSQNQEKEEAGINAKWQYARLQAWSWILWIQHPVEVQPD